MKQSWMKSFGTLAVLVLVGSACAKQEAAAPVGGESGAPAEGEAPVAVAAPVTASANLVSRADLTVSGMVMFSQAGDSVSVTAHVEGAPPGTHGLHVHEIGDCSAEDFTSAGGHFNPTDAPHGAPTDAERHAGDLGNIEIGEDGSGHLELSSDMITVTEGPNSVMGRGVILHEKADDLVSQPTGAAGARLACGVVGG